MGQALYRKYRSKSLDEIVGQEHVTTTIKNAIKSGKISHAYLLTGPRGVGKTSVARILAHEVNGLPYSDESMHLDIIEIDAASNRRIDEIRDLRDKVHIAPTSAKYKVYIIDEVHMLTKEAFNALLKTLEEPPDHVIFILATTEAHKLPETIVSRTQRFSFKPISSSEAVTHLQSIAKSEGIKADQEALELIAEHGDGSFRDSISLLDQAQSTGKKLSVDDVRRILGIPPQEVIKQIITILANGTPQDLLSLLTDTLHQGYQAAVIAKQLGKALRAELVTGRSQLGMSKTSELLKQLLDVPASPSPETLLELILLDMVLERASAKDSPPLPSQPTESLAEALPEPAPKVTQRVASKPPKKVSKAPPKAANFDLGQWQAILNLLKQQYSTLYGVLRMGDPRFEDGSLIIAFRFPFHQKRMSESKNKKIISDIIEQHTGQAIRVESIVDTDLPLPERDESPAAVSTDNTQLDNISNIFGQTEMLES